MAKKFDIRDRLGYRVQNLANKMALWGSRTYNREFNVGAQEWRVLSFLMRQSKGTAREICEFTLMDKGNVSRTVRRLIEDGCVKEQQDAEDKRSTLLIPTKVGVDLYRRIKKTSDKREKSFMDALTAAERKALPLILTKLHLVMDDLLQDLERR
jgi:DNA-binding MarR family transcriptional regulator